MPDVSPGCMHALSGGKPHDRGGKGNFRGQPAGSDALQRGTAAAAGLGIFCCGMQFFIRRAGKPWKGQRHLKEGAAAFRGAKRTPRADRAAFCRHRKKSLSGDRAKKGVSPRAVCAGGDFFKGFFRCSAAFP